MTDEEKRGGPDQSSCFLRQLHPLLSHQLAPLDGTEKRVGLESVDPTSSSTQAPGGLKLQQLSQQGGCWATEPLRQLELGVGLDS